MRGTAADKVKEPLSACNLKKESMLKGGEQYVRELLICLSSKALLERPRSVFIRV